MICKQTVRTFSSWSPGLSSIEPSKTKIDKIRTRVWFYLLSQSVGGQTPYWFWRYIGEEGERTTIERYKSGARNANKYKGKDPVENFAKYFPGTDKIYHSIIWKILKTDHVTRDEIVNEISILDNKIVRQFLDDGWFLKAPDGSVLIEDLYLQFKNLPNFSTLQAIILLLGLAENSQDRSFWNSTCELYREMLPEFILSEDIPFKAELFGAIDDIARTYDIAYVNKNKQNDLTSWTDKLPEFKNLLVEHYMAGIRLHDELFILAKKLSDNEIRGIAELMVELIWDIKKLKLNAFNLWIPLGSFFIDELKNFRAQKSINDEDMKITALSAINKYLKEQKKLNKSDYMQAQLNASQNLQPAKTMPVAQNVGVGLK